MVSLERDLETALKRASVHAADARRVACGFAVLRMTGSV